MTDDTTPSPGDVFNEAVSEASAPIKWPPRIIAVSGTAGSGKSTFAEVLMERGYIPMAFADALRKFLVAVNPVIGVNSHGDLVRLNDVLADGWTWETLKHSPWKEEVRDLKQRTGTDAGRIIVDPMVWVNCFDRDYSRLDPGVHIVVPDVRFANEAAWVKDHGGLIVGVTRPGPNDRLTSEQRQHPSEKIDFPIDTMLVNDSTLEAFRETINQWLDEAPAASPATPTPDKD